MIVCVGVGVVVVDVVEVVFDDGEDVICEVGYDDFVFDVFWYYVVFIVDDFDVLDVCEDV